MAHSVLLMTLCTLTLFVPVRAMTETAPDAPLLPDAGISDSTLIRGTGWSAAGNWNESLACNLAQSRAIEQVKRAVALARSKGLITIDELSRTLSVTRTQQWDRAVGRCIVRMELEIPSEGSVR